MHVINQSDSRNNLLCKRQQAERCSVKQIHVGACKTHVRSRTTAHRLLDIPQTAINLQAIGKVSKIIRHKFLPRRWRQITLGESGYFNRRGDERESCEVINFFRLSRACWGWRRTLLEFSSLWWSRKRKFTRKIDWNLVWKRTKPPSLPTDNSGQSHWDCFPATPCGSERLPTRSLVAGGRRQPRERESKMIN